MQTSLSPSDTLMYIAEYHKVIGDVTSRFWSECCRDSNEEEHGDTQAWNDPVFDVWLVRIKIYNIKFPIITNIFFRNVFQNNWNRLDVNTTILKDNASHVFFVLTKVAPAWGAGHWVHAGKHLHETRSIHIYFVPRGPMLQRKVNQTKMPELIRKQTFDNGNWGSKIDIKTDFPWIDILR